MGVLFEVFGKRLCEHKEKTNRFLSAGIFGRHYCWKKMLSARRHGNLRINENRDNGMNMLFESDQGNPRISQIEIGSSHQSTQ